MYDLAIIGGGPAGVAAGVYAARKRLKTIFIAETVGGQSTESLGIENWIGTEKISGEDLARSMEKHLRAYAADVVELHIGERANALTKIDGGFSVTTGKAAYAARAVLIATGGSRRKLAIPGAAEFENKGLTYCASCDGPLFAGQDVIVVGGGNAGFESAAQLLAYCKSVTLVHRNADFAKADPSTVEAVLADPKMHVLTSSEPAEVKGGPFVQALAIKNCTTGEVTDVPATGIFVEIGMVPATLFAKDAVTLDGIGRVVADAKNQRTSQAGIWAAGDCTDELYHQNNIAAGDGVKALEDIYVWLKTAPK